jgi:hypothetical protein
MELREAHAALVAELWRLRNPDGGWPYYRGRKSRLEPTCWATLGSGVSVDTTPMSRWMSPLGLLVEPATGQVNYAFNGLAALVGSETFGETTLRIATALTGAFGTVIPPSPLIRQDTSLRGWGWTPDTFTWIEPTAWCLLLLKRLPNAPTRQARVAEAEAVLRDRACPGGGWNFGNGEVYGQALPAHVPTTALGVMALQDRRAEPPLTAAVKFLERQAPVEGSTTALALSSLALSVAGRGAPALDESLAARLHSTVTFGNAAVIGMAAHALDCAIKQVPSPVFSVRRERT